jgi:hypothetical protein
VACSILGHSHVPSKRTELGTLATTWCRKNTMGRETRRVGAYVYLYRSTVRRGIALQRTRQPAIPSITQMQADPLKTKRRTKAAWLVLQENGRTMVCLGSELKFQRGATNEELLTFGTHPLLLEIVKARTEKEARKGKT